MEIMIVMLRIVQSGSCPLSTVGPVSLIPAVVALIAGILILLFPRLLNYIVAIYLIIFGILGLVR